MDGESGDEGRDEPTLTLAGGADCEGEWLG